MKKLREVLRKVNEEKLELRYFKKKTYIFKKVQEDFAILIKEKVTEINHRLDRKLNKFEKDLDDETTEFIYSELSSNLLELELNINTIIMNFARITGRKIKFTEYGLDTKSNLLRRGQINFLLSSDISEVYGQNLIFLEEEIKSELGYLELDMDDLMKSFKSEDNSLELAQKINQEYFKINSDINVIIDDINSTIESVYGNIEGNRDMNINLSFLLISAFLSIILFFPEFNSMLNLQEKEVTYEDKIDEVIYEKTMSETSVEELLDIKTNSESEDLIDEIEDERLKAVIQSNIDYENEKLEVERNRIRIFLTILTVILIPFILGVLFIVL